MAINTRVIRREPESSLWPGVTCWHGIKYNAIIEGIAIRRCSYCNTRYDNKLASHCISCGAPL